MDLKIATLLINSTSSLYTQKKVQYELEIYFYASNSGMKHFFKALNRKRAEIQENPKQKKTKDHQALLTV